MAYLSAKKIYPADMAEPLNGWYQNIDTRGGTVNNASKGGPTSVLATPGYRYFQQRGYVPVTTSTGDGYTTTANVIIPSPYKNDDTRTNITGMTVDASATLPAYVYRATISVASGWGDGRIASELVTSGATQVIGFGPGSATAPTTHSGQVDAANLTAASNSIAAGAAGYGLSPLASGVQYKELTADTTYRVYSKTATNSTATNGGWAISDSDKSAGNTGYILVELCYIQPDVAMEYDDIEQYIPYKVASNYPGY
jgi:hypothetical protein